jgi:hypothetical protein
MKVWAFLKGTSVRSSLRLVVTWYRGLREHSRRVRPYPDLIGKRAAYVRTVDFRDGSVRDMAKLPCLAGSPVSR